MKNKVVFVGIFGCSASGKTSIAALLASQLHSPFLAISLDRYYDDAKVQQYKTAEHFHTLCIEQCYKDLLWLKQILQHTRHSDNIVQLTQNLHNDTQLPTKLRSAVRLTWWQPKQSSQQVGTINQQQQQQYNTKSQHSSNVNDENNIFTKNSEQNKDVEEEEEQQQQDDDSLIAHQEEDYKAHQNCTCQVQNTNIDLHHVNSMQEECDKLGQSLGQDMQRQKTIYVICEGFVLFCVALSRSSCSVFDVAVQITCEAATMCYRRFCRTPRRVHLRNTKKEQTNALSKRMQHRLVLLQFSRTEQWRQALQAHLFTLYKSINRLHLISQIEHRQQQFFCKNGNNNNVKFVQQIKQQQLQRQSKQQQQHHKQQVNYRMLLPCNYFPPQIQKLCNQATNDPFVKFWQDADCNLIPSWAHMQSTQLLQLSKHYTTNEFTQKLAQQNVQQQQQQLQRANADTRWNEYCQFRYWFFFEVYYYYLLFLPYQQQFIAQCAVQTDFSCSCYQQQQQQEQQQQLSLYNQRECKTSNRCLSLTFDNGRRYTRQSLRLRVRELANSIRDYNLK